MLVFIQFELNSSCCSGMVHARACLCVTKSAQGTGKLIFGLGVAATTGEVQKCQNGVSDLGIYLENEKFQLAISRTVLKMFGVLRC